MDGIDFVSSKERMEFVDGKALVIKRCGVDTMPQTERTEIIIEILRYLNNSKTLSRSQILAFIRLEATALGATARTAVKYFTDLGHYGLIENVGRSQNWRITDKGRAWLERHGQ